MPKVSIGLPVYNGERYLEHCIESILAQSFTDFDVFISDNASSDRTQEICEDFARKDSRIIYFRQEKNIGAGPNFNFTVPKTSGEYFKWAAHDDIIAPELLQKFVAELDANPEVGLVSSQVEVIDENGLHCDDYNGVEPHFNNPNPVERFESMIKFHRQRCYEIFGLFRRSAIAHTELIRNYKNGDGVMLAELCLHWHMTQLDERLLLPRKHAEQSQKHFKSTQKYNEWFDPSNKGKLMLPHWYMLYEFNALVSRSRLTRKQKLHCRALILKQCMPSWRQLGSDVKRAALQILDRRQVPTNSGKIHS